MAPALNALFAALALLSSDARFALIFFGTSYAPDATGVRTTTALAREHNVDEWVHESPARIGYIDSLRTLLETDLALVLGSSDRSYSPSKLYPTLIAGRPTLALAPRDSILATMVQELGGAMLVTFDPQAPDDPAPIRQIASLLEAFARNRAWPAPTAQVDLVRRKYSAAAVAFAQLEIFNAVIGRDRVGSPLRTDWVPWPDHSET
jgi:hypothetical protein